MGKKSCGPKSSKKGTDPMNMGEKSNIKPMKKASRTKKK